METNGSRRNQAIWFGVAIGAAVGLGLALSRRQPKGPWASARQVTKRMVDRSGDFSEVARDIADRVKTIYEESRKVVDEATELWSHGRRLVGY